MDLRCTTVSVMIPLTPILPNWIGVGPRMWPISCQELQIGIESMLLIKLKSVSDYWTEVTAVSITPLHNNLHLHLCPISFPLVHYLFLLLDVPHDLLTSIYLYLHLCPLPIPLPLPIFLPLPLSSLPIPHYSHLHLPHYQVHVKLRSQIIQWLDDLMPLFNISLLQNCGILVKRLNS